IAGGKDYAEAVIADGPGSVLTAGAATEVRAGQQHGCAFVAREVQYKFGIRLFAGQIAPVIEKDAAKTLAGERLQELFRHHLVGVYIDPIHRCDEAGVCNKWLHLFKLLAFPISPSFPNGCCLLSFLPNLKKFTKWLVRPLSKSIIAAHSC